MSRLREMAVLIAMVMTTSACGGGSSGSQSNQGPPPPGNATSVVVTPGEATVYQGMTAKFQAQVMGQSNQAVAWSVEQGGLGAIDSTGLYTAPRDASGGPFHVVAISQAVSSAIGSAAVTVLVPQVTIAPSTITLGLGGTQTFTATVKGLVSTNVTWTVQEAEGGSVSDAGLYNAPQATGFFHVVATSVADATFSGTAIVTVTNSTGRFTPTGSMQNPRGLHTATLLGDGKVLVAGGAIRSNRSTVPIVCLGGIVSAELYDVVSGSFTATGDMTKPRYDHTATLLLNGQVLVTGGFGNSGAGCEDGNVPVLSSAELYNPSTGSFEANGGMAEAREGHTATLLANGKVLVAGGADENRIASKTAELYDPLTSAFSSTGSMITPRFGHTAAVLANGKVLIAGGIDTTDPNSAAVTAKAEIYDPTTGAFTTIGSMATARSGHTATMLADGRVLITGGITKIAPEGSTSVASAELYSPTTNSFSPTGTMGQARAGHTATLLSNGTVLVAGGGNSTAEIYDPSTGSFSPTGGMETGRTGHSATLLLNGKVLVAGAVQGRSTFLATAELYK